MPEQLQSTQPIISARTTVGVPNANYVESRRQEMIDVTRRVEGLPACIKAGWLRHLGVLESPIPD